MIDNFYLRLFSGRQLRTAATRKEEKKPPVEKRKTRSDLLHAKEADWRKHYSRITAMKQKSANMASNVALLNSQRPALNIMVQEKYSP
jgi:hypothetical protein